MDNLLTPSAKAEIYQPKPMKAVKKTSGANSGLPPTTNGVHHSNNNGNKTPEQQQQRKKKKEPSQSATARTSLTPTTTNSLDVNRNVINNRSQPNGNAEPNNNTNDYHVNDPSDVFDMMKDEKLRLLSFDHENNKWPHADVKPEDLAKTGFYYLCNGDRVKCAFCHIVLENWQSTDDPLREHLRSNTDCPFLLGYNVGNKPINPDTVSFRHIIDRLGHDQCGGCHQIMIPNAGHRSGSTGSLSPESDSSYSPLSTSPDIPCENNFMFPTPKYDLNEFGVRPHHSAKNPKYVSVDVRFKSFGDNWNPKLKATPLKLAEAGFYYCGYSDFVKCFYCDGGLCEWDPEDDPWVEHGCYFSDCDFVILNKGRTFIESCKELRAKRMSGRTLTTTNEKTEQIVNEWMQSDIVKQLQNIHMCDEGIIRTVLQQRWLDKQEPFKHLADLVSAIAQLKTIPKLISINLNSDREEEKVDKKPPSTAPKNLSESGKVEQLWCKICLDKEVGVLFLPCGHVVACTQCAPGLEVCPICRKQIKGIVRTFFS